MKVWLDVWSPQLANLTVIRDPQIHLIWRGKMNLLMKSSKNMSSLMRSLNIKMFMKMLKILHKIRGLGFSTNLCDVD
jgi:hypothetical protein